MSSSSVPCLCLGKEAIHQTLCRVFCKGFLLGLQHKVLPLGTQHQSWTLLGPILQIFWTVLCLGASHHDVHHVDVRFTSLRTISHHSLTPDRNRYCPKGVKQSNLLSFPQPRPSDFPLAAKTPACHICVPLVSCSADGAYCYFKTYLICITGAIDGCNHWERCGRQRD